MFVFLIAHINWLMIPGDTMSKYKIKWMFVTLPIAVILFVVILSGQLGPYYCTGTAIVVMAE